MSETSPFPTVIVDAIEAAVQARAARLEMTWLETQEREIRFQQHVLPAEHVAELAERNAIMGVQIHIAQRAREIEDARLATVPEQSEWHIFVHGKKEPSQYETCSTCDYDSHTCHFCGEWLYHSKGGACGPCAEEDEERR